MDKITAYIIDTYGIYGVITIAILFVFYKHGRSIFEKLISLKFGSVFVNNTIFILNSKLVYWIELKIPSFELNEKVRTSILTDMLLIKFNLFKSKLALMETSDIDDISSNQLYNRIIKCLADITTEFDNKIRVEGIPEIVISRYNERHKKTYDYFLLTLESLILSDVYDSNKCRLDVFHLLLIGYLQTIILDVEQILSTLNGSLSGKYYKGRIIGKFNDTKN